jgi:ATP-dependent Clp protease ATP-binding subunit ClpC
VLAIQAEAIMSKAGFRVFFSATEPNETGEGSRLVGVAMRRFNRFLDKPPPSAFGRDEDEVLRQLATLMFELEAEDPTDLERYLWTETFATRRVDVEVNSSSSIGTRSVIGSRKIPLRLTYAYCPLDGGGFRVDVPRFGWWFVVEDLSIAKRCLEQAIATSLLGEKPKWVFNYRYRGPEYVSEWAPSLLAKRVKSASRPHESDVGGGTVLDEVGEEWVGKAERKRLQAPLGGSSVFSAFAPMVEREYLPSLLLVGSSGAGKTTFVRRLAYHLLDRRRGKKGEGRRYTQLWATSADRIVAGMAYLGMWQDRVLKIVDALSFEGHYLYVDRLPALLAPQSDGASIADLMADALGSEEISLIAECDERELVHCRQRNPAFVEAFQVVHLREMPTSELVPLLEHFLTRAAANLTLGPGALQRALRHLAAFRRDVVFPGRAFQFVEFLAKDLSDTRTLNPTDMSAAFSRFSGLPVQLISDDVPMGAQAIAERLQEGVIGQNEACQTMGALVARFKAGLDDPEKPVATTMFVGPTGVGKTELAKQLANFMFGSSSRFVRVDMSEYMVPGAARRLLESGPGVTSLAEKVRQQPLSVVLLDEIEKAHPEVFDLLLGVLGEGRLTDVNGRLVDFRMCVIVMTSNLGVTTTAKVGFGDSPGGDYLAAIRNEFRPEFVARLDHILAFAPLGRSSIEQIVDLEMKKVAKRTGLKRRGLRLRLSSGARDVLATRGYDPHLGARPLKRLIEDRVVAPLAVLLARDPDLSETELHVAAEGEAGHADLRV